MSVLDRTRTAVINGKATEIRCLLNTGNNWPEVVIIVNDITAIAKRFHHGRWQDQTRHQRAKEMVEDMLQTPDGQIEAAYNIALDEAISDCNELFTDLEERLDRSKVRLQKLNKLKREVLATRSA
jgi:hypothetical protein